MVTRDYWIGRLQHETLKSLPITDCKHISLQSRRPNPLIDTIVSLKSSRGPQYGLIVDHCGFYVKVELIRRTSNHKSHDWVHLLDVKPLPHRTARKGPQDLPADRGESRSELHNRLCTKKLFQSDLVPRMVERLCASPFRVNQLMEILDVDDYSRMRTARVVRIVGRRLFLTYVDDSSSAGQEDYIYYVLSDCSPEIHQINWSRMVGCPVKNQATRVPLGDAHVWNWHMAVVAWPFASPRWCRFRRNTLLEFVHPFGNNKICLGIVDLVLQEGVLRVRNLGEDEDFCHFHYQSPYLLPLGFCRNNDIPLSLPEEYRGMGLGEIASVLGVVCAQADWFEEPRGSVFAEGMALEVVDSVESHLVCVATVRRAVSKLLLIHFLGWNDSFDQWLDYMSTDIYPVGWCRAVGFDLQLPE